MKYSNHHANTTAAPTITNCRRILIVRLSALGDVCLTLPFLSLLKARGYFIGWVIQEQCAEIVRNHPMIDQVYQVPWKKWKSSNCSWLQIWREYQQIIKQIRSHNYQIVIDAQGLFKSWIFAVRSGAIYHIANRKARECATLFATHLVDLQRDHRAKTLCLPHIFLRYLSPLGIFPDPAQPLDVTLPATPPHIGQKIKKWIVGTQNRFRPLVIIAPATTWPTKHWNTKYWRALIDKLPSSWQLVFTGDQKSLPLIQDIARAQDIILAGKTTLPELIAVFRQSHLVISLDSGSTHLAWATQKPKILAIYCATNCIIYNNCPQNDRYRAIAGISLDCQPCCKRACPLSGKKHNACTNYPSVEQVLHEALALMRE